MLRTGLVPADWLSGAMRCVYKRGDPTVFTNFRGVVFGAADATGPDDGRDADVGGDRPPSADGDDRASDDGSDTEIAVEGPDSAEARRAYGTWVGPRATSI